MSKIELAPDASGTGTFTIASPNDNSDYTLTLPTSAGTVATQAYADASSQTVQMGYAVKTDTFTLSTTTWTDVTDMSVTLAAISNAANKVVVTVSLGIAATVTGAAAFRVVRDSTAFGVGAAAGSRPQATTTRISFTTLTSDAANGLSFTVIDVPGDTSIHTYKLQMAVQSSYTGYINRSPNDSDGTGIYQARAASSITVTEIQ